MRLYAFVNYYLSPLQHGLQTAHLVSELFTDYQFGSDHSLRVCDRLQTWANAHKTIIILKGGNSQELETFYEQRLKPLSNTYPAAIFHEDQQSLNGACTVTGIVLPEEMYGAVYNEPDVEAMWGKTTKDFVHRTPENQFTVWRPESLEWSLLNDLKGFKLA